jgi:hypothetical protein
VNSAITECVLTYSAATDIDGDGDTDAADNPNPPYPLYNDLSSAGAGETLADIKCPGAPASQQLLFNNQAGHTFKVLSDTATYTATYFNDGTEGVMILLTRASGDTLWTEAISRLNAKYSTCKAANVTAPGPCVDGCFYFWVKRLSTSVTAVEGGCP